MVSAPCRPQKPQKRQSQVIPFDQWDRLPRFPEVTLYIYKTFAAESSVGEGCLHGDQTWPLR